MKKFRFLMCLLILAALSTNAKVYTLDLQSGTLTPGSSDTAPLRSVEQTDNGLNLQTENPPENLCRSQPESVLESLSAAKMAAREKESIIDENKVWMYVDEYITKIRASYYRFNGTTEINDKTYHNLYLVTKQSEWEENIPTQSEWDNAMEYINEIPEFDFENIKPAYYMRQEVDKYYTLWGNEYFNPEGEQIPGAGIDFMIDQYGSNIIESLVYDFSVEPGGSYYRVGGPDTEFGVLNEAPKGYYSDAVSYLGFEGFNKVNVSKYVQYEDNGNELRVQCNYFTSPDSDKAYRSWYAIENFGGRYGLAIPGIILYLPDSGEYRGLTSVRTLEGDYILGKKFTDTIYFKPSGIGEISGEEAEAEYYGMDGCKVQGNPAPGIYLERKGNNVRKVIIR